MTQKLDYGSENSMELLTAAKNGDKQAADKLVELNTPLVKSMVRRFSCCSQADRDDLMQIGFVGLIKAIKGFDPTYGVRFSTYAVPMIIGEVRRYLRDNNSVRVSRSLRDTAYKAIQVRERLSNELNREPRVEEIAKELDINKEDVVIALEAIVEPVSLYEPVYNEGGDAIYVMDQIGDRNTPDSWMDEIMIRDSIKKLSQREKNILNLRFMLGKTQTEVAKEIGISQAQVSRLEKSALKRIKGQ